MNKPTTRTSISQAALLSGMVPAVALAGCLPIPHPHLVRPSVSFAVTDSAGRVVPARLAFYTANTVGNGFLRAELHHVGDSGQATVEERVDWHSV